MSTATTDSISSSFSQPQSDSLFSGPSTSTMPPTFIFLPIPENPVGSELKTYPLLDHDDQNKNSTVSLELSLSASNSGSSSSKSNKRPRIDDQKRPQKRKRTNKLGNTISTELRLGLDPWSIKKTLESSDIGHLSRLIVAQYDVKNHILPYLDAGMLEHLMNEGSSVKVPVWDMDTETEIELRFKRWRSSGSYLFNKNWVTGFVKRRGLNQGDQIGFFWDGSNSRFNFSVLKRAS